MACGCAENSCSCIINGAGVTTVSGAGTVANPFVVSTAASPTFAATNPLGGILITPNGTLGHAPALDITIDPASTAPVSVSAAGIKVDCCATGTGPVEIIDVDTDLNTTHFTVLVDNTLNPITVTLPAVPAAQQRYEIKNYGNGGAGNAAINNITIDPNGANIDGVAGNIVISNDTTGSDTVIIVWDGVSAWATILTTPA